MCISQIILLFFQTPNIDLLRRRTKPSSATKLDRNSSSVIYQLWHRKDSCPEGTVPIRRVQKHHLLNAPSIERYGMKNYHEITKQEINLNGHTFAKGVENYHSVSIYNIYFESGNFKKVALTQAWLL